MSALQPSLLFLIWRRSKKSFGWSQPLNYVSFQVSLHFLPNIISPDKFKICKLKFLGLIDVEIMLQTLILTSYVTSMTSIVVQWYKIMYECCCHRWCWILIAHHSVQNKSLWTHSPSSLYIVLSYSWRLYILYISVYIYTEISISYCHAVGGIGGHQVILIQLLIQIQMIKRNRIWIYQTLK